MNMRDAGAPADDMAVYWLMALKSAEVSPAMLRRWEKWIAVPAHRVAFDEAQQLWEVFDELPPPPWPSDAEVKQDVYDGATSIAAFEEQRQSQLRRRRRLQSVGLALAAVVGAVAVGLSFMRFIPASAEAPAERMAIFETQVAQHERVALMDGSEMQMGGRTTVTTNLTRSVRFVVVNRGEARFEIAHDPKRPFRVLAGAGVITAVGTVFNVRRLDNLVVVTVGEGIVEVAPASPMNARDGGDYARGKRVTRGQYITYDGDGRLSEVRSTNVELAMAWRTGQLRYDSEPLNRVVQDINRYSRQLISIDTAAGDIVYSGTVFERDIDDWLEALERLFPEVQVTRPDNEHVVISTKPPRVL